MKAAKVLVSSLAVIIGFSNKAALTRRHGPLRQKRGGTIHSVCHHEQCWQVACLTWAHRRGRLSSRSSRLRPARPAQRFDHLSPEGRIALGAIAPAPLVARIVRKTR